MPAASFALLVWTSLDVSRSGYRSPNEVKIYFGFFLGTKLRRMRLKIKSLKSKEHLMHKNTCDVAGSPGGRASCLVKPLIQSLCVFIINFVKKIATLWQIIQ